MSYSKEFHTVELIIDSAAETRAVDAFALSLIKAERQIRRLLTYLVYQFPCFGRSDVRTLCEALAQSRHVYFEGLERGFDALYCRSIEELVGAQYGRLRPRMAEAMGHRNKIFHGQLTANGLRRDDLLGYVGDIRSWCKALAEGAFAELGYDGFARNSFRKSEVTEIWKRYKIQFQDVGTYRDFIRHHMEGHKRSGQKRLPMDNASGSNVS